MHDTNFTILSPSLCVCTWFGGTLLARFPVLFSSESVYLFSLLSVYLYCLPRSSCVSINEAQ